MERFNINVPEAVLDDLRHRLAIHDGRPTLPMTIGAMVQTPPTFANWLTIGATSMTGDRASG